MSKGLEVLEELKKDHLVDGRLPLIDKIRFELIEKELKALEIIRSHCDNSILERRQRKNGQIIHYLVVGELGKYILSEEQYNLLKEVLL